MLANHYVMIVEESAYGTPVASPTKGTNLFYVPLPEANASGRVLAKCGFRRVGEVIDPDDGVVWRWEIRPLPQGAPTGSVRPAGLAGAD